MLVAVFACTLEMINKDMEAYPEHRINFFQLLSAIDRYCFNVLIALQDTTLGFVIQAIVWAFKHSMRNVAELGKLIRFEGNAFITLLSSRYRHPQGTACEGGYDGGQGGCAGILSETLHEHSRARPRRRHCSQPSSLHR